MSNTKQETIADIVAKREAPAGNTAAMREALGFVREMINDWNASQEPIQYCQYSETIDKIDAVLSAPARNCDVGTAEEQAERYKAFCMQRVLHCSESSNCPAKHPCNQLGINYCQLKWAQMPYAPAEGGADGK